MTLHLNIGSNLGDRRHNLAVAAEAVIKALPGDWTISDPVASEPWGFESANPFLNIGMMGELAGPADPLGILDTLQAVERSISASPHRDVSGAYIDRLVDIDIISIDDPDPLVLSTPRLKLPHPRGRLRDFVIIPLRALSPSHPLLPENTSEE